jgi:hypothetical protein
MTIGCAARPPVRLGVSTPALRPRYLRDRVVQSRPGAVAGYLEEYNLDRRHSTCGMVSTATQRLQVGGDPRRAVTDLMARRHNGEGSIYPYRNGFGPGVETDRQAYGTRRPAVDE